MTISPPEDTVRAESISFRMHPRVFTALGSELVTSDIVAVIELAKNAYDAGARRLDVRFDTGTNGQPFIELDDTGHGMDKTTIRDVWCVVATPFRLSNTHTGVGTGSRRVSGEKGLGRLAAARLGRNLSLITKAPRKGCWRLDVNWEELSGAKSLDACQVVLSPCNTTETIPSQGTRIRITNLKRIWTLDDIAELREQLSRLLSPFGSQSEFEIFLTVRGIAASPDKKKKKGAFSPPSPDEPIRITPPSFLENPPYKLEGEVNAAGNLVGKYQYSARGKERTLRIEKRLWSPDLVSENAIEPDRPPGCGPFSFEIRVWDVDNDSIASLAERFSLKKTTIRGDIRRYQGISLYRDGILVLPKSDAGKDWLGLDLRRVSKVGERISTNQTVGYVAVTADRNPGITDTSDRERLEDNRAARDFRALLVQIVKLLEDQRALDKSDGASTREAPFQSLFESLSAAGLTRTVIEAADRGAPARELVPIVEEYAAGVAETVDKIERRLIQYSGLASLGTIAGMLTHEIRNHSIAIGRLCRKLRELIVDNNATAIRLESSVATTEQAVTTLLRLADTFAPLSSAGFRTRKRDSILEDVIRSSLDIRAKRLRARKVTVEFAPIESVTKVAVDPGELLTVILNLLDNALHWISFVPPEHPRRLRYLISVPPGTSRVVVQFDDTGPGVAKEDEEKIFWPGVTRKKEGLGMGLTVASEVISQHKGEIALVVPGYLGGATFRFDLPLRA